MSDLASTEPVSLLSVLERIATALERIADREAKPARTAPAKPTPEQFAAAVELGRRKARRKGLDA